MDYGRYKYEQKKKAGKGKGHAASLKEVKLRPRTDQHDMDFKLKNARRFLMDGDKVKVTVMFRGREMVHRDRGRGQLDKVAKLLTPLAKMENPPRMEGRFMSMILVADREAVAEAKRAEQAKAKADAEAADIGDVEDTQDVKPVDVAEAEESSETQTTTTKGAEPSEIRTEE
jgi:translation initiation factor IF-3